ncbi:hypothetical protein Enr10x_52120 [Gimesia panareensis]|uniref:Uncharacterized protein n=1 Tax=Gimesia panareensis TaxID=2527978 RepID=A0A517QDZ0_9PLAN|nr:hypothetical protein Enr10x_52120 [Gimesia panareensis]QDU52755.1 hypothetical protein Pan110_51360 [Gimesia panareensis]
MILLPRYLLPGCLLRTSLGLTDFMKEMTRSCIEKISPNRPIHEQIIPPGKVIWYQIPSPGCVPQIC